MYYRLEEPETDVEAVVYQVEGRLENQLTRLYVKASMGVRYGIFTSRDGGTALEHYDRLEEAIDAARERCARDVKVAVLNAEAERIRSEGR